LRRFEYAEVHMGMPFKLVLYAADEASANTAAQAAYQRITQLDGTMSDYKPESELSRLSATAGQGRDVPVSSDLWRVLTAAGQLSEKSDGAFDVTVGPYVKLWRRARREKELPSPQRLAEARAAVGYKHLKFGNPVEPLDPVRSTEPGKPAAPVKSAAPAKPVAAGPAAHTVRLTEPHMRLDLGGIAAGYAIDEALAVLRAHVVTRALVDASGDIVVGDPPPGARGWRIGIAPLSTSGPPSRFAILSNAAVTTSGDAFQHVEIAGQRYSHIVDPHTGLGLTDRSSVTVIARDGITADSFATAVSVLGPKRGLELVEAEPAAAALIVRQVEGQVETHESRRLRDYVEPETPQRNTQ